MFETPVRVPDAGMIGYETHYRSAPEICVEIRSPSNSEEEMRAKVAPCLDQGAREVWMVFETGTVRFFGPEGKRARLGFQTTRIPS